MIYNLYCDESCHLENDFSNDMVLGAIWCPQSKLKEINKKIKEIKRKAGISDTTELKWTKVSPARVDVYKDLINYFFDCDFIMFRALIVLEKKQLNHKLFNQTHDDWYYKMYYEMLRPIFSTSANYEVYIDIKDTNSNRKAIKLNDVLCNSLHDFSHNIIRRVQPVRSDEICLMQIVDLLIGALAYENRNFPEDFRKSKAKQELINLIKRRANNNLHGCSSYLNERKFNLFFWRARDIDG